MGQRDFAGPWDRSAADQRLGGCRMVRRADRALVHQRDVVGQQSQRGVNARRFERFGARKRRQNSRDSLGEHRFAGPWRTDHQEIVTSGGAIVIARLTASCPRTSAKSNCAETCDA